MPITFSTVLSSFVTAVIPELPLITLAGLSVFDQSLLSPAG
jgi:hypothetical protein